MRTYVIKIKIDSEWKYFRSYDIEQHALEKFDLYKELFDVVLFDNGKIVKRFEKAKE